MSGPNLDEQIQETIVKYLDDYAPDHNDCECSNSLYFIHELKKELLNLIATQQAEARYEALNNWKYEIIGRIQGKELLFADDVRKQVKDRLNKLKEEQE